MTGRFEADPGPFLRPYALTEGRTEPTGADLATHGMVTVHRAPSHAGAPTVALLEQVLDGLQRL